MSRAAWLVELPGTPPEGHARAARLAMAPIIARLRGLPFAGVCDIDAAPRGDYFIPEDCLDQPQARSLGVDGDPDLFGGVVPHAFVAGKAVAHPLVGDGADRPVGWTRELGTMIENVTLPGYSAYSGADAIEAARRLLAEGAVRIKRVLGVGGRGQWTVHALHDAREVLDRLDPIELRDHGVVLERHLDSIDTLSIGEARIGDTHVCYHGVQRLVRSRDGTHVYGGSTLHLRRGGLAALLQTPLPAMVHEAVRRACAFDRAVGHAYPGFFSSRRNYDVACGHDAQGRDYCGVLEQSWRIGGASPAEILAMNVFATDPAVESVTASTHEHHSSAPVPAHAVVYWNDPHEPHGPVLKYATVDNADTA